MGADDWAKAWEPVQAAVGKDFSNGNIVWGADAADRSAIRRYLEPLEFDCPLHVDPDVARAHGFENVTAPYTATLMLAIPPVWSPGKPTIFDDDSRDAQPARSNERQQGLPIGPRTKGFFATDIEMDFVRPVIAGERVGRRGRRLLECTPKETSVGRGAFLTWESELVSDRGDVVAVFRTGLYAYEPSIGSSDRDE